MSPNRKSSVVLVRVFSDRFADYVVAALDALRNWGPGLVELRSGIEMVTRFCATAISRNDTNVCTFYGRHFPLVWVQQEVTRPLP